MTLGVRRQLRGARPLRLAGAILAIACACWLTAVGADELQVIELRYRLAEQVIPTLQPLLEPGGVITGMDAMLFVRTSPGNFEQIRQAVAVLDRKPRQLRVTVGQGTLGTASGAAVRGTATVGDGDVQVGINRPPGSEPGAAVTARQGTDRSDLRNVSSVTTLEGTETFIAIGQSAPVTRTQVTPGWAGPTVAQTTEYRDASTGFYATPRVNGETVTLDLSPQQQRLTGPASGRRIETAGMTTQVSGRLGEWILVGGSNTSSRSDSSGLLSRGARSDAASYSVWVRVDDVP